MDRFSSWFQGSLESQKRPSCVPVQAGGAPSSPTSTKLSAVSAVGAFAAAASTEAGIRSTTSSSPGLGASTHAAIFGAGAGAGSCADSPGSLNSGSLTESPSPQPATPRDSQDSMTAVIDLTTTSRSSSSLPIDTTKSDPLPLFTDQSHPNFDPDQRRSAALRSASHIPDSDLNNLAHFDNDFEMTTGPSLDAAAAGRGRQDSFVSSGAKPISMNNPNRDNVNRNRRESLAGSLMGGRSWGGLSFGSFVRDE